MTTVLKTYPHFELQQITEIKIKTKNKKQTNKKQIKQTNQTNKSNKLKLIPSASLKYVPRAKLLCWRHL
jgi:hypothetical protein